MSKIEGFVGLLVCLFVTILFFGVIGLRRLRKKDEPRTIFVMEFEK